MTETDGAEVVTFVMDGGTAYVLTVLLGMTIDGLRNGDSVRELAEGVLFHAHDQIAAQLDMPAYADRKGPFGRDAA